MKSTKAVTIIGGADGPTSVFLAGQIKGKKKPLKQRIRQSVYRYRRWKAAKTICADPHTLQEVLAYARQKYPVSEIPNNQRRYTEQYTSMKEALIIRHKPALLGDLAQIARPDTFDEKAAQKLFHQMQLRSERAASIPDDKIPMDFHIYEIKTRNGHLEMTIDFLWDYLGISCSGNRHTYKNLKKLSRALYLYYGVSAEDIRQQTERYKSLLLALST